MINVLFRGGSQNVFHSYKSLRYLQKLVFEIVIENELGLLVFEPSSRISKFYAPTDFEHKFNKTEMKN